MPERRTTPDDPPGNRRSLVRQVAWQMARYPHRIAYVLLGIGCALALALCVALFVKVQDTTQALQDTTQQLAAVTAANRTTIKKLDTYIRQASVARRKRDLRTCRQLEAIKAQIRQTLLASARPNPRLKRFFPQLSDPSFLKEQRRQVARSLRRFQAIDCQQAVSGPRPPAVPIGRGARP